MERTGLIGKKVSVYFNDGVRVTRHDGVCTCNNEIEIILDYVELIPKRRIIRVEAIS